VFHSLNLGGVRPLDPRNFAFGAGLFVDPGTACRASPSHGVFMALAGAVTQQALCNRSRAGRAHGFLASDAAVPIAGIALPVDGGWTAH